MAIDSNSIYIKVDGTTPWENSQSMGNNKLIRLANATDDYDAVPYDQFVDGMDLDGNEGSPAITSTEIAQSATSTVATTEMTGNRSIRYLIAIKYDNESKFCASEVLIVRTNSGYEITESAIVGNSVNYNISVADDADYIYLRIENLESATFTVDTSQYLIG